MDRLMKFHGNEAKGIVWEHNTHIGDARATNMKRQGMINIGQLAREEYGDYKIYLVGFASYKGTVIAGNEWGAPMEEVEVPAARPGSIEDILHKENGSDRYILFSEQIPEKIYETEIHHRAIGVVYNAANERLGNYVPSVLSRRYDAFIFLDETTALHPLHMHPYHEKTPETYPFGF